MVESLEQRNLANEPKEQSGSDSDAMMTREVQVSFKTTMPERYQVGDTEISLSTGSGTKELTQIVK